MKHIGNILLVLLLVGYGTFYYLEVLSLASRFEHHAIITFIYIALALLAFISVVSDVRALIKNNSTINFSWRKEKRPFVLLVSISLYLVMIPLLGFFTSSLITFTGIAVWLGSRSWKEYLLVPVLMLGVVYMLFVVLLGQRIVSGFVI